MKNLLLILFLGVFSSMASAQTACPTPPPPGSDCTNCPKFNITFATCPGCSDTLKFVWGYEYPNCTGQIGAGYVLPGSPAVPANPWTPPCLQFCDDPCKCPLKFQLIDPNTGTLVDAWGNINVLGTTSVTYTNIANCGLKSINVSITYALGEWTFHFYCT